MFLPTLEFRLVSPGRRNRLAMRWIKGGLSVSATIILPDENLQAVT